MSNELMQKVEAKAVAKATKGNTIYDLIESMKGQIQRALPSHIKLDRFIRTALTAVRQNPALATCSKESFLASLMMASQLGLEPNILGQCYFVPYGKECQFLIGYRGMIDIARRTGQIQSIYAECIYEHDDYAVELGLKRRLAHIPLLDGDRGKMVYAYACCHYKDGGYDFTILSVNEIEKIKKSSRGANSNYSPWNTFYEEMAKKTALRRLFKTLPVSPEVVSQIEKNDETIKKEIVADMTIDADAIEVEDIPDDTSEDGRI